MVASLPSSPLLYSASVPTRADSQKKVPDMEMNTEQGDARLER
jgi:hypothetical protein